MSMTGMLNYPQLQQRSLSPKLISTINPNDFKPEGIKLPAVTPNPMRTLHTPSSHYNFSKPKEPES